MARTALPVALQKAHLTKEEIQKREEQEQKLKGNSELVYSLPTSLKSKPEKDLYLFLVTELKASSILNNLDITILEQTVDAIIKMRDANKLIKKHGLVLYKEDGTGQKNPAVQVYKDYQAIFYQCSMSLGLSPSARAKLGAININKKEDDEDLVKKAMRGDN